METATSEEDQPKITAVLIVCKELFCKEGSEVLIQELERIKLLSNIGHLMYDENSHALTPEASKNNSSNSSIPVVRDTSTLYGSRKVTSIDNDVFGNSALPFYK